MATSQNPDSSTGRRRASRAVRLASGVCAGLVVVGGLAALDSVAGASAKTVTVKIVKTKLGPVLATSNGRTLYRFTEDSPTKVACTRGCMTAWPPLLVPAGAKVAGVKGLGTIKDPSGTLQVTFDSQPLYRFEGDKAAGQVNGQGVENTWFVVKTTSSSSSTAGTAKPSGGGYGY